MSIRWSRLTGVWAGVALAVAGLAGPSVCSAEPINLANLKAQAPKADHNITTLGPSAMGDKANLFNGSLEFEHTDARLPGNSALPMAIVRRHVAGRHVRIRGAFADWDLDVPRIGGNFARPEGWVNAQGSTARCTQYSSPPYVSRTGDAGVGGGGAAANPASGAGTGIKPTQPQPAGSQTPGGPPAAALSLITVTYQPHEFWQGNFLHIPGSPGQEVLKRNPSDTAAPSDGNSYPLVTKSGWQIRCLPALQNGAGEGFVALSPEGTQYRFDWLTTRFLPTLKGPSPSVGLGRDEVMIAATLVTDRFGNTVSYTYAGNRLTRMDASDGRAITLTYGADGTVSSVFDGTRSWTYAYSGSGNTSLSQVTLPDNSRWLIDLRPLVYFNPVELGEGASCSFPGGWPAGSLTGTITHPSGAVGTFETQYISHGRDGVTQFCINKSGQLSDPGIPYWPKESVSQTLVRKTLVGPGLPSMSWTYNYPSSTGSWAPCNGCTATKVVTVTDPQGFVSRHTFGTLWRVNEGQLLRLDEGYSAATGTALRTTTQTYRANGPWPEPAGLSVTDITDHLAYRHRPMDQRVISQDGSTFSWLASATSGFDSRARPLTVTRQSSLGYSRTETTAYFDHSAKWVLGQIASITDSTGVVPESNTYHPTTANRVSSSSFGRLTDSYTWYPNGLLQAHQDAAGRSTTFSSFMRGLPQLVSFADSTTQTAVVNNLGLVTSLTNQAGTTTGFGYDAMGRLASITHPTEPGLSYFPTTQVFEPVAGIEYGLGSGHWRQTVATGNARTVRYYDGLWRERLVASWDAANPAATSRFVETRYDANGHKSFSSYPQRNFTAVDGATAGQAWGRDALGREFVHYQDSELGLLQTQTQYLAGLQRRVTNPRGYSTTFGYQAFDDPSEQAVAITNIWAPEGTTMSIVRDRWGKAASITRSGSYGGQSLSVTRSYVYDANQRLCKTIEPESGATVQAYDLAGNVAWTASGQTLPGASCDQASVPQARKISHGYDALNRLTSTTYGDGSAGITRTYTADGLLSTISSGLSSWSYGYNNRRLLTSETLTYNGVSYPFIWIPDAHGNVAGLNYPGGPNLAFSPDALGKPTQVSGFASGVTHHPNGQVAGYTLANGIAHSATQNTRGKPLLWRDAGVQQDLYTYDANGNVAGITDQQQGVASRTMGYDGLDRLTSASGIWGSGLFGYDPLDNLRASTVGSRTTAASLDANHRLASLVVNGTAIAFGYDANGNLSNRGAQGFAFDIGNRLLAASGKASYGYDGHGRRSFVAYADGKTKLQIYSKGGQLLGTVHSSEGLTRHIYLGQRLIAEVNSLTGTSYAHTDALGSPVARTNTLGQLISRTRYEPYGATAAVAGNLNPTGIGFTGHVNDADTGLVYMQQRYYEPIAGRFLSVDQVKTDTKAGKFFSRYEYAGNNPYKYVDPDGREKFAAVVKLLENGGHKIVGTLRDKADAVAARIRGENVITATSQQARQVEVAAHGAGDSLLRHKGHRLEDGSTGMPHYQTDGKPGHTFWGQGGGVLPGLLEAVTIPILMSPSGLAPGTLYGPGTQFPTREAFDRANGAPASNATGTGNGSGFQGVFKVSGRVESKALDKELSQ